MVPHRIRISLAILLGSALLAFILRSPANALMQEPLALLWWLVDSLPQQLIWGVLTIIGFPMVFSLARGPRHERPVSPVAHTPHETETQRLTQLILLAENSYWAREVMGRRLSETAAALRALRHGTALDEARHELRTGAWLMHPLVSAVLRPQREEEDSIDREYSDELAYALDAMEGYAEGGSLECN